MLITALLLFVLQVGLIYPVEAQTNGSQQQQQWLVHIVERGDSLWRISNHYGVPVSNLQIQNSLTSDMILEGQPLFIRPVTTGVSYFFYEVKAGDTPWLLSHRFQVPLDTLLTINNFNSSIIIYPGNVIRIPFFTPPKSIQAPTPVPNTIAGTSPNISYISYSVKPSETPWTIAVKHGIPMEQLLKANNMTERDFIVPGQRLVIPVHHIPVKPTVSSNHGELLDWWTEAQYLWPIGKEATIIDFYTKKSWEVVRSYGASHADVEPLTPKDTAIMREAWGGQWSWAVRPVLVVIDGRMIAASANGMPHSIQEITNNNFNGHFCIHFLNSRTHGTNVLNQTHQNAILIAAGTR